MPTPIHGAVSGAHTVTFGGKTLGYTESGYTLEYIYKGQPVNFEEFADSTVDMVNRGAEVHLEATLKEWHADALQSVISPWNSTPATNDPAAIPASAFGNYNACPAGQLAVQQGYADELVLTPYSCTPSAAAPSTTVTYAGIPGTDYTAANYNRIVFHQAIMAPEFSSVINFDSNIRMIPVRFVIFLVNVGTDNGANADFRHFTITNTTD